jgi:hypothetical protein
MFLSAALATASLSAQADETPAKKAATAIDAKAIEAARTRIRADVEMLASDAFQGRGLATKGADCAAEVLKGRFANLGLKQDLCNGGPYQTFTIRTYQWRGRLRVDWSSFAVVNSTSRHAAKGAVCPAAGSTAKTNPNSKQRREQPHPGTSSHAANADEDEKANPKQHTNAPTAPGPAFAADKKIKAPTGKRKTAKITNVVAVLEGKGPLAHETIIIGAHYDHLGETKDKDGNLLVYNGANDNASGTAAMLEIARTLSTREKKLPRRIVFIAFAGEEHGLLGSQYYVKHPLVPLEDTVAMLNLDMIGRLGDGPLMVMGSDSSRELKKLVNDAGKKHGVRLWAVPAATPCSDHAPFYARRIPVAFFTTVHDMADYHEPTDTADKVDYEGVQRISRLVTDVAVGLAESKERPKFTRQGIQGALMRSAVRLFGRALRKMAGDQHKQAPADRKNAKPDNKAPPQEPKRESLKKPEKEPQTQP